MNTLKSCPDPRDFRNLEKKCRKFTLPRCCAFLGQGHDIARRSGGRGDELTADPKIVVRSRVLRNNYLERLFYTVPSSFVLHCSFLLVSKVAKEPSG